MAAKYITCAFLFLALAASVVHAAQTVADLQDAGGKEKKDKDKKTPDKKLTDPPQTDIFAQAPIMGRQFATGFNPNMMGDFGGFFVKQIITIQGVKTTTTSKTTLFSPNNEPPFTPVTTTTTVATPFTQTKEILVFVPSSGAFKVGENSSPRPQDRVFFTYHYFDGLRDPQNGPTGTVDSTLASTVNGPNGSSTTTALNTFLPGTPRATANLHREVFGFEKTFFGGLASIELRLPMLQQNSNLPGFSGGDVGDLTIIGKYAFFLDPATGNVLAGGLGVTAPTGPGFTTIDGTIKSTRLQPWGGYIWNFDLFFVQGFHSVAVPTDARDVTLLFNDASVNFWLYRGGPNAILNFIVPSFEAHVTNPLNHRDGNGLFLVNDQVILTGGLHLGLFGNATVTLGAATPVTGPRPYSLEGFVQLNWRF